ncbi:MAG: TIGR03668 family PPOX class F420-dependent oxidoreductase [Candidatus Limnocylindria bacterium]
MGEDEARRRFGTARVARLGTAGADGSPHVVPIVFALDHDLVYSVVDAKPKASRKLQRLRHIEANPRVSLLVDEYDEDWARLWWVRADGTAHIVDAGAQRDRGIELLRAKYSQYADLPDAFGAAIVVRVERWASWSFRG